MISVLIDSYNSAPWLRSCVESALAQTRPADEIIVYDDGSTDDSVAILRSYGERIRLIEGVHQAGRSGMASQAAAIATAFASCRGDHVYLLDGDDAFGNDHIQLYEALWSRLPAAVMIQGPMAMMDESGVVFRSMWDIKRRQSDYRQAIYRRNEPALFYPTSALAFRRDFLAGRLPLDIPPGFCCAADAQLAFAAVFSGPIGYVEKDTVFYRLRNGSLADVCGLRGMSQVEQYKMQAECFNRIAAEFGQRPIRLWRNFNYVLRVVRGMAPRWIGDLPARLKLAWDNRFAVR